MKVAIRVLALVVAIAGLASASFAPASTQALSTRSSARVTDPGPTINLPYPPPCSFTNSCFVAPTPSR